MSLQVLKNKSQTLYELVRNAECSHTKTVEFYATFFILLYVSFLRIKKTHHFCFVFQHSASLHRNTRSFYEGAKLLFRSNYLKRT